MTPYTLTPAWGLRDPSLEQAAIGFWRDLAILPQGVDAAARAAELVALARQGDTVAGVSTAAIQEVPTVRSRFAMFRCAVAPAHRRSHLATDLLLNAKTLIEQWSLAHPEARVRGLGIVLEADIGERGRIPLWPQSGMQLAGYTPEGRQLRLAWFAHARIG